MEWTHPTEIPESTAQNRNPAAGPKVYQKSHKFNQEISQRDLRQRIRDADIQKFPKGNKAIDQLFKLALTFINLGKNDDACASFSKLELEFPDASERIKNRAKEYKTRAKC